MSTRLPPAIAAAFCVAGGAGADRDIIDVALSIHDLPQSVARTLDREMGGNALTELEEVLYEGVPVLYEAESLVDGREHEVVVRPNGELVFEQGEGLVAREVTMADLPAAAADALGRRLGGVPAREIEEVRYDGIVVLYEVEVDPAIGALGAVARGDEDDAGERIDEFYVYPYGAIAVPKGDLIEREVAMDDLTVVVAEALRRHLGGARPDEIEEIRFEGVPILYEAEIARGARGREVAVLPTGERAVAGAGAERDGERRRKLEERPVGPGDLPAAVARTVREHARGAEIRELEEIRYEGITVLFEAEFAGPDGRERELYVYPGGLAAAGLGGGDDDDEGEEDEDGDGDSGDGDSGEDGDSEDGDSEDDDEDEDGDDDD